MLHTAGKYHRDSYCVPSVLHTSDSPSGACDRDSC